MRPFFIFLFLLFTLTTTGQDARIVKDNIACLYGIKHSSGEWLVKPEYTLITYQSTPFPHFKTLKNNKSGLIDTEGKVIAQPIYDEIMPFPGSRNMRTRSGNYYGAMDISGYVHIVPDQYDEITEYGGFFVARKKEDHFLYFEDKKIYSQPFSEITLMHNGVSHFFALHRNSRTKKIRTLIDKNLDTILEVQNAEIYTFNRHFIVQYPDSSLVYDGKQKKFVLPFSDIVYTDLRTMSSTDEFRFVKGDKIGLANVNGDTLIPPLYDQIEILPDYGSGSPFKYQIQLKGNYGYYDRHHQMILAPEYRFIFKRGLDDILLLEKNAKIGVFNLQGKPLTETRYKHISDGDYRNFLYDSTGIYLIAANGIKGDTTFESRLIPGHFAVKLGSWSIYNFNNWLFPIEKYSYGYVFNVNARANYSDGIYTLYYGGRALKYDSDGKAIPEDVKQYNQIRINDQYAIYKPLYGGYGVIDSAGQIVLETSYPMIFNANSDGEPLIWIQKTRNEKCRFYEPEAGNWYLCRPDGTPVLDFKFDIPSALHGTFPVYMNNKCGIYDFARQKFVHEPEYDYVNTNFGISGYMLLFDQNKDFYLLKPDATFFTETKWQYAVRVNRYAQRILPFVNLANSYTYYWLFMNETDTLAVSQQGDTTSHPDFIYDLIHHGNVTLPDDPFSFRNAQNSLSLPKQEQQEFLPTVYETIDFLMKNDRFDFKFKPESYKFSMGYPITDIQGNTVRTEFVLGTPEQNNYVCGTVTYCSDNSISVSNSWYRKPEERFINLHRSYGYLFEFGLKDIFRPDVNIEDAMIILLTEAIHGRDDLFLNCHNPKTIFDHTGKVFSFDDNGLYFYLVDERTFEKQILIPWKKLMKYAPEKGIVADFLKLGLP